MLRSRKQRWIASLLVDGTLLIAFLWPVPGCACTPLPPDVNALAITDLSAGRIMQELALAQELYHRAYDHYADRVSDLGISIPGWNVRILDASPTAYRMRVSTPSHTCVLWRSRLELTGSERFYVNCGLEFATRGARQDHTTAPHN